MHPLRLILIVSLAVAAAFATAFGYALRAGGVHVFASVVLGATSFVAFLIPWSAVFAWALRRASDLDLLTDRTRGVAAGRHDQSIADRPFHGELDDLARGIEELRAIIVRQQESYEEHWRMLQQIVASIGEGLIALSARGRIVFANDRVVTMFGGPAPIVGKSFLEVVRMQPLADAFQKALRGESSAERFARDDRQIEMRVMPVSASTEVAAVALFIDISQMEKLQRMRREFLDDFSHEVRTPLAGLRSAAETFEHPPLTPPQEQQLRRVILRQLARIERLVKDLSELSRIESGELVLEPSVVDLRQLLADLCDDFRERTPARITLQGEPARACVDPPRVQQVFTNLLDNASKYGGDGEILIEVKREDGHAVVRVSDEGEGIPPAELERIFQRFYRIDKSRSQEIAGVGLGLSIAKHLVILHGGSIRAYNRATGGATFEVRLPAVG